MGSSPTAKTTLLPGPVIVGAGPSGLAVAACLADLGIHAIVLEKSLCIASLWQNRTYDRLKLHLPKQFCELPLLGFPKHFPKYPSKQQFISYMESYASTFSISPRFGCEVISADHDATTGLWSIRTSDNDEHLLTRWLVAATGENAEAVDPDVAGKDKFAGKIIHTCSYKSGAEFEGEKVLVVGCGNSGMEVCLDLHRHNAEPHMVVRNTVHVLPREMFGMSTFGLTMSLLRWLPVRMVDKVLLTAAQFTLGDTDRIGLRRPKTGPIELKNRTGKTPVLDVGALSLIKSGKIKVMVGVKEITKSGAKFVDGKEEEYDAIILATGYRSNVPSWLKGCGGDGLFSEDGMPNDPYPNGWKGVKGLYCVGFTRRGLLGTSADARNIARDVYLQMKEEQREHEQ